jgi:hypothetical protein
LPPDFIEQNRWFVFSVIEDMEGQVRLMRLIDSRKAQEVSFSRSPKTRRLDQKVPVSLPVLVSNAKWRNQKVEHDQDFYDYLLSAHLVRPVIGNDVLNRAASFIAELRTEYLPAFEKFNVFVDPHSVTRIALSLSRMDFATILDDSQLWNAWKLCEPLYKDYLKFLEDTFDPVGAPSFLGRGRVLWYEDLTREEAAILEALKNLESSRVKGVAVKDLRTAAGKRVAHERFDHAISGLSQKGRIVFVDGEFMVKLVD